MKIGYPCLNYSIKPRIQKTFRLASYSEDKFIETVRNNLVYLKEVLCFNVKHGLFFFRISSDIIPFAAHPVQKINWQKMFREDLREIGQYILKHEIRVSMHPNQFVLINSPKKEAVKSSIDELIWHAQFLGLLGLDSRAKLQIHVGGVYEDRRTAIRNFIANYLQLPSIVKNHLVIENDDKCFPLNDCLKIYEAVGIPVIFDNLHHECLNQGETLFEAMMMTNATWSEQDGLMMVDYSSQQPGALKGRHIDSINIKQFSEFLSISQGMDFDIMLEIRNKEKSALKGVEIYKQLRMRSK